MTTEQINDIRYALNVADIDDNKAWDALNALLAELDAAQKREQAQQAAWDRDWQAAVAAHDKCVAELDAARAREQALKAEADTFHMQYRMTCDVESKAALVRAEQAEAREAKTREALKAVLPFVATQRMACGGMKCRESWCESCQGEDDAEVSAQAGREAHEMALAALAEGENR